MEGMMIPWLEVLCIRSVGLYQKKGKSTDRGVLCKGKEHGI